MWRVIWLLFACVATAVQAAEDSRDTYPHRSECPESGDYYKDNKTADSFSNFVRCQCTSYVAHKLSELFAARSKPSTFAKKFHNNNYYMPQGRKWTEGDFVGQSVNRWTNAMYWYNSAKFAGIGITGATDNFSWDPGSYNAVFRGDVAHWKKSASKPDGHVAFVEDVQQDIAGKGVKCIKYSDYNSGAPYQFRFTDNWVCKNTPGHDFPDYFLHIDQDHAYCTRNPTVDNCAALNGGQMVASSGSKADGLGGGSDTFNLKIDFDIMDPNTGNEIVAGQRILLPGQVIKLQVEVDTDNGSVLTHMRPGKSTIKVDYYYRLDDGEWVLYARDTIQDYNLGNGSKVEYENFTVPAGISEVSFKTKIDAEDDGIEANEGDNWSRIETFSVLPIAVILEILED